jgi:hypothetical protein
VGLNAAIAIKLLHELHFFSITQKDNKKHAIIAAEKADLNADDKYTAEVTEQVRQVSTEWNTSIARYSFP